MGYFVFLEYYDYKNRDTHGQSIPSWKMGGYMTVENGGNTQLKADKYRAEYWETFGINVINDGALVHGSEFHFRSNGDPPSNKPGYWIGTESATEGPVLVAKDRQEIFTIKKKNRQGGDEIHSGDSVYLQIGGRGIVRESEHGPLVAKDGVDGSEWQLTFHP